MLFNAIIELSYFIVLASSRLLNDTMSFEHQKERKLVNIETRTHADGTACHKWNERACVETSFERS